MACFQVLVSCCWTVSICMEMGMFGLHSLADVVVVVVVIVFVKSIVFQIGEVSKPWCD